MGVVGVEWSVSRIPPPFNFKYWIRVYSIYENDFENSYIYCEPSFSQLALREPQVGHLAPEQMITSSYLIKEFDLKKDSVKETEFKSDFTLTMEKSDTLSGFATYFETIFSQCHRKVMFTTSPRWKSNHWSQTAFYLKRGFQINGKDEIAGSFKMKKNGEYFRDLDFELSLKYKNEFDNIDEKNNYTLRY